MAGKRAREFINGPEKEMLANKSGCETRHGTPVKPAKSRAASRKHAPPVVSAADAVKYDAFPSACELPTREFHDDKRDNFPVARSFAQLDRTRSLFTRGRKNRGTVCRPVPFCPSTQMEGRCYAQ